MLRGVNPLVPLSVTGAAAVWYLTSGRGEVNVQNSLLHYSVFFFIGLYGREVLLALLRLCGAKVGIAAGVALVLLLALPLPHTLVSPLGSIALLLAAQGLASTSAAASLAWFGRRTPEIYLAHQALLVCAAGVIGTFGVAGLAIIIPASIAGCIALRAAADHLHLGGLFQRPAWATLLGWTTRDEVPGPLRLA